MEKLNNGDLISREELEKALATLGRMYIDGIADDKAYLSEQRIYEVLRNAPTVEAEPVVRGEWEVVHGVLTPGGDPLLRCPRCRSRESEHLCGVEHESYWDYCPKCGARLARR